MGHRTGTNANMCAMVAESCVLRGIMLSATVQGSFRVRTSLFRNTIDFYNDVSNGLHRRDFLICLYRVLHKRFRRSSVVAGRYESAAIT